MGDLIKMATDTTDYTGLLTAGINALGTIGASNAVTGGQNSLAQQQLALGQQAANNAQFRPVGITSRFGTSGFQYDQAGNLIGAGYQVAPDIAAMREGLLGYAGQNLANAYGAQGLQQQAMGGAQGLFNLGQQYVAQSPQAAAQTWMGQQQQLLAPGREQQLAQLQNQQFQQGRGGLAVGATNQGYTQGAQGLAATNPQMAAYYNALAQQDAQLAAQAQQQGQAQTTFGQGLMTGGLGLANAGYGLQSAALAPYTTALGAAGTTEALGSNALDISSALGAKQATAGSQVASVLGQTAQQAAATQQAGLNAQNAAITGATAGGTDAVNALLRSWAGGSSSITPAAAQYYNTQYAALPITGDYGLVW
jgi:hypothetical protein